jgi:hypothetical protein
MNKTKTLLIISTLTIFFLGCTAHFIKHDPDAAGQVALSFAKTAFVDQNYEAAMRFLPEERDSGVSAKMLKGIVDFAHSELEFPEKVELLGYRSLPGQRRVEVFLRGYDKDLKPGYYTIVLLGDADMGYGVAELYGNTKQPAVQYQEY